MLFSGGQAALATWLAWLVGDNICEPQHSTHIYTHMVSQDHPQGTDSLVTTPSHQLSRKASDFLMCEEIYFKKKTVVFTLPVPPLVRVYIAWEYPGMTQVPRRHFLFLNTPPPFVFRDKVSL